MKSNETQGFQLTLEELKSQWAMLKRERNFTQADIVKGKIKKLIATERFKLRSQKPEQKEDDDQS